VMYPGANEQIIFLSLSLSCAHASTSKTFGARCNVKQEKKKKNSRSATSRATAHKL
jgi:hypothetical protein